MSFYTSLTGLKAAQSDLATVSNNVANVNSTAFKKSRTNFGDIFAAAPMQTTTQVAGQGTRITGIQQQFTQGTVETTDKTLDLAITGEAFFTVKTPPPTLQVSYTRNGAFSLDDNRYVVDTVGGRLQVFPYNSTTSSIDMTTQSDLQIPLTKPGSPTIQLSSVGVTVDGTVTATFADSTTQILGQIAMAAFPSNEGLRQKGDAHWEATLQSGAPVYGAANAGLYGAIRSGALERSNVDLTEELVALISAQRNFQANAKAIETASTISNAIVNLRS
ncbi:MAG: flagellar hook-basal body complex protein [Sphingobium sp.]|jgi:flagellar hook protein FlgE|nr:flagellar hook-basal body complex protein [Sphingobium sp.]MCI1270138.1 flagellar hook-basal body complex protein [Sphingobium sp.]MCI1754935.1 flagellar hook-basal body complex protein [Sphingobium sp.]MCI2051680.1 flagellar hook-basal body complex protein [Sphingobium sp.]